MKPLQNGLSVLIASLVLTLASPQACFGAVVFEYERPVSLDGGARTLDSGVTDFELSMQILGDDRAVLASIFDGVVIDRLDVGEVFTANHSTDPQFTEFVNLVADGNNSNIRYRLRPNSTTTHREACLFARRCNVVEGADLKGFEVNAITYTVLGWDSEMPGTNPNGDGIWTDRYYGFRLTFEGAPIPEPSSVLLAALATMGSIWRRATGGKAGA